MLLLGGLVMAGAGLSAATAALFMDTKALEVSVLLPLGAALMRAPASAGDVPRAEVHLGPAVLVDPAALGLAVGR